MSQRTVTQVPDLIDRIAAEHREASDHLTARIQFAQRRFDRECAGLIEESEIRSKRLLSDLNRLLGMAESDPSELRVEKGLRDLEAAQRERGMAA